MKDEFDDIGGHISKENDNYTVKDNFVGENLLLS
ncbi:MAG: cupin, partial [Gammaproteobacteria bacterium]|nr:cupin [Gammaproteobacteria bacterium]